jgi:hypothetical protein
VSFLAFLEGDARPDRVVPNRLYARVDVDESADRAGVFVFDGVDAVWFDAVQPTQPWLAEPQNDSLESRVSMVEVESPSVMAFTGTEPLDEGRWLEIELSPQRPEGNVRQYINLFAAPVQHDLIQIGPVKDDVAERLQTAHSLEPVEDASQTDIEGALDHSEHANAAAVYDVGQGACNALIRDSYPVMYFDLGGGVRGNARTYPRELREFCFGSEPPIVLSHWDQDHWASAQRDTEALDQTWVVPRQGNTLLSSHLTFLAQLLRGNGSVLVWPEALPSVTAGSVTIERCTGSGRNNSGLAMTFRSREGEQDSMLFPADSRYDCIPLAATQAFTSLVASHHGGRTKSTFVPASDGAAHGRLVFSVGAGNTYKHPLASESQAHHAAWGNYRSLSTDNRIGSLGHVHLYWSQSGPAAVPLCHASPRCQLLPRQR